MFTLSFTATFCSRVLAAGHSSRPSGGPEPGTGDAWEDFRSYMLDKLSLPVAVVDELKAIVTLPVVPSDALAKLAEVLCYVSLMYHAL